MKAKKVLLVVAIVVMSVVWSGVVAAAPAQAAPVTQAPVPSLTPEQLSAIAGALLSLAFSYLPGLSEWFDPLEPRKKRLVMVGVLVVTAVSALGLSCANVIIVVECTQAGLVGLITNFLAALVANQSMFLISKRDKATEAIGS